MAEYDHKSTVKIVFNPEASAYLQRAIEQLQFLPAHIGRKLDAAMGSATPRPVGSECLKVTLLDLNEDESMICVAQFAAVAMPVIVARAAREELEPHEYLFDVWDSYFKKQTAWTINGCKVLDVSAVDAPQAG